MEHHYPQSIGKLLEMHDRTDVRCNKTADSVCLRRLMHFYQIYPRRHSLALLTIWSRFLSFFESWIHCLPDIATSSDKNSAPWYSPPSARAFALMAFECHRKRRKD